jgi:hypothetical protein
MLEILQHDNRMRGHTMSLKLLRDHVRTLPDFPSSVAQRPEVSRVIVVPAHSERHFRIVHLCNWHLIPQRDFEAVLKADGLRADEIDRRFAQHELRVESIQREQYSLMTFLVPELQLRSIHLEGLCDGDAEHFLKRLRQISAAGLIRNAQPSKISTMEMIRQERLLAGTAGQLLIEGVLDVLPVEDRGVFEAANPFKSNGGLDNDSLMTELRESAMVRHLIHDGATTFVILGGLHDLSDNIPDDCEYVRIETTRYSQLMNP